ncbi:Uncharacterised protein [Mycobacteroides abscessus subsp. abscessus]|nr:Uncharacterised protein [Mycobacteroides abscessus subsp. abscessus]
MVTARTRKATCASAMVNAEECPVPRLGPSMMHRFEPVPRMTASTSAALPSAPTTVEPSIRSTAVACTATFGRVRDWR